VSVRQRRRHTLEGRLAPTPGLTTAGGGSRIESQPGGYRLRRTEDEFDVLRFERLLEEGRSALAQGASAEAEAKLTAALRLWRGEVLADLAFEPFAAGEVDRLEELRLAALEARATAALALGRHAELVGELRTLVAAHPFREGLRGQLMLTLYRSGRQADALTVYLEGRRRLVDELGIEPSRQLQELQGAILRQDPALDQPAFATDETASLATEPVASAPPPLVRPLRKVVTVVVCELSESTGLAARLDPEALAALLERYFERLKAIAEGHGGTVAKSIGDTLMAEFGVPLLHEDDALRACRAAMEMRGALPELGVRGRIGIATGEVIVGTQERLATGAAVQLAAQLAHAARRDEILLGAETVRMLGPLVEFEPVAPVTLRGQARGGVPFPAPGSPHGRSRGS
jgi:class 3 adenylate cyclase